VVVPGVVSGVVVSGVVVGAVVAGVVVGVVVVAVSHTSPKSTVTSRVVVVPDAHRPVTVNVTEPLAVPGSNVSPYVSPDAATGDS
jgi:hypothetical protein